MLQIAFILLTSVLAQYPQSQNTRQNTVQAQLEFHTALAERLYNLMATIVNTNVNIILWLKKSIISFLVRAISYVSYFIANNPEFVNSKIDLFAGILKTFASNVPYFVVPSVAKRNSGSSPHEYAMPQSTEPAWLYEMPNFSFLNLVTSDEEE